MKKLIVLAIIVALGLSSCFKIETQAEKDDAKIQKYLDENNLNAQKTSSGLYYSITKEGTGINPSWNSYISIYYKGYLLDGTVFDASEDAPFKTYLYSTIEGWQQGIPKFKVGGEGQLFIPSRLAYGSSSVGDIPPNSVLIFDIELISAQ